MDPTALLGRIAATRVHPTVLRYVAAMGAVAVVSLVMPYLPIPRPLGGIIGLASVVYCAWRAGFGPALMLPLVIFVLSRFTNDRPAESIVPTSQELMAVGILTAITAAVGLAGEYRRRIRSVTRQHAQKLRDQARALSLAHIVFRGVDGRITEWSEGVERMFGWTSAAAVGCDLHKLLRTRFPEPFENIQNELFAAGQWQGEVVHSRKDGIELIVATHWILYRDRLGEPIGVAEIYNDVSKLRQAEEAVREADRRKDEFLATLAHELRNPLAPIRTGLELMKLVKDQPHLVEETRCIMERQTQQLMTLVDDLLNVSRITRGKLELRKCRVDLSEAVQSAIDISRPLIEEGKHDIEITISDEPIHLHADPHRLTQVISNLLNNAAKYTPAAGRISITAERQGSDAVIAVQDTGIGIPAEMLDRIFEMFAQVDRPQERGHTGLGIGLTLVKSLTEMHGGSIEARSAGADRGSTFTVRLPILIEAPAAISSVDLPVDAIGSAAARRVLVVDDNKAAADMLSMLIKMLGNEVRTAGDGQEAIEVAAEFLPEVVLMDLGMPRMNGYQAARQIREQPWGRDMLLVALTGWGKDEDKRKTREAGFDHHLTKPAEPSVVQNLLAGAERNAFRTVELAAPER